LNKSEILKSLTTRQKRVKKLTCRFSNFVEIYKENREINVC